MENNYPACGYDGGDCTDPTYTEPGNVLWYKKNYDRVCLIRYSTR